MTNSELKSKLSKSIEFLKSELSQLRTGRASPALLEDVTVDAYGSKMTIKELGNITLLDTQTLMIVPWDKGLLSTIATAIRTSKLGLNPVEDSDRVRVPIPPLTEERRKEFTKMVAAKLEECKSSLRNIRQEAVKELERDFTDKKMGEDEKFRHKEEIEKTVKEAIDLAEEAAETKKKELMTI